MKKVPAGFYDKDYFENGVKTEKSGYGGYHWNDGIAVLAQALVTNLPHKTALDLGCAKGYVVKALRDLGIEAFGIDISTYAIDQAPAEVKPFLHKGSAAVKLKMFEENRFDLVICYDILEHLDDDTLVKTMTGISRVCSKWVTVKLPFEVYDWDLDKSHINIKPKEAWIKMFGEYGFENYELPVPKAPWSFWDNRTLVFRRV